MRDIAAGTLVAKQESMNIWRIGSVGFVAVLAVACSSAPSDENTEDGWGELQSGEPLAITEYAVSSDVDEADLDDALDPVAEEDTWALDDVEVPSGDDSPDVTVNDEDLDRAGGLEVDHVDLGLEQDIMLAGCANPGKYAKYAKGDQLVTTEWLNLRKGAGTNYARVATNAPGTGVVVLEKTCGKGWAHIKDSHGRVGWSSVQWLRLKQKSQPPPSGWAAIYSAARGQKLASKSWNMWHDSKTSGFCLKGVRLAISGSISPGFATGSPGAHQFGVFARSHRAWMSNRHLKVYARGESGAPSPSSFPKGTIMVFSKGRCGMNATWGHVEIVVNSTVACSDHCRKRTDKQCGPDTIIVPRK